MPLHQKILQFHLKPDCVGLLDDEACLSKLDQLLTARGLGTRQSSTSLPSGRLILYVDSTSGRHATVRTSTKQPHPVVFIDIVLTTEGGQKPSSTDESLEQLHSDLLALFQCRKFSAKNLPVIQHGTAFSYIYPSVDNRWSEYDFDRLVFEEDTPYQNVKILHSVQYGNVLILDDDINLAESDIAYTKAITGNGRENFAGKRVLILGGGDGGILNHLLPQSPAFVEMVEIDQVVIDQAIKNLRGICGSSMDSLSGPNYKVRVEDCVPVLEQYVKDGVMFDYIINDLTAIPISTTPQGSFWDFMRLILSLSMKVLAPTGKYFTQGNSYLAPAALTMYEGELAKLEHPVEFSKETATVPSYQELWVFYEIWKKQ